MSRKKCQYSDISTIGGRIRRIREIIGKSQQEFAMEAGISRSYLSEVENNSSSVNVNIIYLLYKYKVRLEYIFRGEEPIFNFGNNEIEKKINDLLELLDDEQKLQILEEVKSKIKYTEEINRLKKEVEDLKKANYREDKKSETTQ